MNSIKTIFTAASLTLAMAFFTGPGLADGPAAASPSGEARSFVAVDVPPGTDPAVKIAAQACAGLMNRESGGSVYTRMNEKDDMWLTELGLAPDEILSADDFLDTCLAKFPRGALYSYREQRELLPNILTVAAALEAIPLDEEMGTQLENVAFDARKEFKELNTPYLATRRVYENYVNQTAGLAMLNPGYRDSGAKDWDPEIARDMDPSMIDFVFSEKLFVAFLVNGCIKGTRQHALLNDIASQNPWPKPIGVYGYASYWKVFGGYLFEAQTTCADSRNMGAIPTTVNNLSFFSTRRRPIVKAGELTPNEPERVEYDPDKTYVAFVVGDGDNIAFIMDARADWLRRRVRACREDENSCPPLTWSISPHLVRLAPDVIEWYYETSRETGKDYFMLPPSGHLYSYPASMEETAMQDMFVAATENDARLLGTMSTVHWEWFNKWTRAEKDFLPRYAKRDGAIRGVFPVNVPYMFPTFTWEDGQFFKVLDGGGGEVVLFRPREWRGVDEARGAFMDRKFYLRPEAMAQELRDYPRGTVTAIYMTSDGGLDLDNSLMELIKILPERVRLISGDAAVRLALEARGRE